ncbi:hypothetical protein [Methylococcus sp. EFPC2]|uniref:hypothetical protein n=1 Tax=Methylococcus sp. EFPC2 TaxID=2812648 RepID=UPI001966CFF3|nr:hypothetical protein [Methylococcus sp. EFPC2]QSA98618.1 hypothetical protein JWZ97_07445 [Methylococcus sp. EFPC2]
MVTSVLAELHSMGLTITTDGRHLTVTPASKITDETRQLIRAHRDELLAGLVPPANEDPIFWRVEIRTPNGRRFEIDAPSGVSLADAERWAVEDFGPGCNVAGLVLLEDAYREEPLPGNGLPVVRCSDCKHATTTDHAALIDCAALVPSPAAAGPYRRWASDQHVCTKFEVTQ